jgi:predicted glycoside hydrolase/deacetylase ChbG (UPF0249 family)
MKLMKILLNRAHVRYNDYLLGMTDGGRMTVDLVSRFVQNLPEGVTELCFHPATRRCAEIDRSMPRYHHEEEYLTLTSRTLRESIQRIGVQTIAFSDLCGKT